MMNESHRDLLERIREKCHHQRWFGPDGDNPISFIERERERQAQQRERFASAAPGTITFFSTCSRSWYDRNGKRYEISADTDLSDFPLQAEFEYAPATEAQLAASEEELGYALPPLLRSLYATLANGGFGPGYGLRGVAGGYYDALRKNRPPKDRLPDKILEQSSVEANVVEEPAFPDLDEEGPAFLDLEEYEKQHGDPKVIDIGELIWPTVWSRYFIVLCAWGCGRVSHLHAQSGRVYHEEEGLLVRLADSLEEWLERWLQGENLDESSSILIYSHFKSLE